jgi:hypothetical protein
MEGKPAALARVLMRWWLPLKERKRSEALKSAFNAIRNEAIKSKERGFAASAVIFNIALYFLIAERDIQCLKIDALTHPDEWKRKLCSRVILLTIYEWDMDKVSGSSLRSALDSIGASEHAQREAVEALRLVRIVQKKARKEFGFVRNSTIAHRDADAVAQYHAINDLKTEEVFRIAVEFYKGAERFIALLPELILESGSTVALLRQWFQNPHNASPT